MSDTLKEYTIRYSVFSFVYESKVRAASSNAALMWAKANDYSNARIVEIDGVRS